MTGEQSSGRSPDQALALFNSSREAWSSSRLVAARSSFNCSTLVALAIDAVMPGRAMIQASATLEGAE